MKTPLLALLGTLTALPLAAQDRTTRVELGAGAIHQSWAYDADLRPAFGGTGRLGVLFPSGLGVEAQGVFTSSKSRSTGGVHSVSHSDLLAFVTYTVPVANRVDLLFRAGGGLAKYGGDCPDLLAGLAPCGNGSSVGGGAGLRLHLGPTVALRGDGYLLSSSVGQSFTTYAGSLGLSVLLGGTGHADADRDGVPDRADACPATAPGVSVDPSGCPVDGDRDGVPDRLDRCPLTPPGVAVDAAGCPLDADRDGVPDAVDQCAETRAGAVVNAEGCAIDSDGDGVPDGLDRCPATPAGSPVDAIGCPADLDGDGVPDALDRCPGTPRGATVDPRGCAAGPTLWTLTQAALAPGGMATPEARAVLDEVAAVLRARPELVAEVRGFGPLVGRGEPGRRAVLERAAAVRDALVARGIPATRLRTLGVAGEETPRVDIALVAGPGQ